MTRIETFVKDLYTLPWFKAILPVIFVKDQILVSLHSVWNRRLKSVCFASDQNDPTRHFCLGLESTVHAL